MSLNKDAKTDEQKSVQEVDETMWLYSSSFLSLVLSDLEGWLKVAA